MQTIKKATLNTAESDQKIRDTVETMLADIETRREDAVIDYARRFDNWTADFRLTADQKATLIATVPETLRDDIQFAQRQVKRFAEAQRDSQQPFEIETEPGVRLGQRIVPVGAAGCYIPGGRYAHIASAIMTVTTAKVAGVPSITACTPPRGRAIDPAVAYTLDLGGADMILQMGGVQGIATMAFGLFGCRAADIIVGPGNAYVAEAKRVLFGRVGIDLFAGPTESAIIADETADPMTVAIDLVSQAEHGVDSPVWLFTTSPALAHSIDGLFKQVAADLPHPETALAAWHNVGEVILCDSREEVVAVSDQYASEHLQVMTADLDWWLARLNNYGSLFLGAGSTVTHGDKCAGTNHILPTKQAGRYTGGLNVQKFMKVLTYQQLDEKAGKQFSAVASRISRAEGMEGHARACDWRLRRAFPDEAWGFEVYDQADYARDT